MFDRLKRKSVLSVWVISCIALMLIPSVSNFYMLMKTNTILQKENGEKNLFFLQNMASAADNIFSSIDALRAVLNSNTDLAHIAAQTELKNTTRYNSAVLSGTLGRIIDSHRYIDYFYVYYPALDFIVSPDSFGESRLFYSTATAESGESREQWMSRLNEATHMSIFEKSIHRNGESYEVTEFLIPLQFASGDGRCVAAIRVKKSVLFGNASNIFPLENSQMLILSSRGIPLLHYGELTHNMQFENIDFYTQPPISTIYINGTRMNLAHLRLHSSQYYYVYLFPDTESTVRIKQAVISMIVMTMLSLAAMLIILYALSKWNYGNLQNILRTMGNYKKERDVQENEFSVIAAHIHDVKQNRNALAREVDQFITKTKNSFLAEFLKGYATMDEIAPLLSQYNIEFEYGSYAVVAINITITGAAGHGTVKDAIFIVDNMTMDCLADAMKLTRIDTDGRLFYIINMPDDVDFKQEVVTVFSRVAKFAQKELGLLFLVSMSSVSKDLSDVPSLYREALLAMDYGTFYGVDDYFFYDEVKSEPETPILIKNYFSSESTLMYFLREHELEKAQNLVETLLTDTNNAGTLKRWQFNWLRYNIMNTIMKSIDPTDSESLAEIAQYAEGLETCRDLSEVKQFFNKLLQLHVDLTGQKNIKNKNTGDKIKEYIDANISDPDLCTASIGVALSLSPLYLARLFKNQTGVKLINYINEGRIRLAKDLLIKERKMKIEDVAKRVGFYNTRTFLKLFKDTVGLTPTQYRSMDAQNS